jgi:uncharacterized membrane protein HdeD (DUF308 family)
MENKPEPLPSTARISLRSRPTIIGILNIISGVVITAPTIFGIFIESISFSGPSINYFLKLFLTLAIGIFILFSGIQAMRFRSWKVVLAGSICNLLLALFAFAHLVISNPWVSFLFGIPSLILTIQSKRDFSNQAYALSNWFKSTISGILNIISGVIFISGSMFCLVLDTLRYDAGTPESVMSGLTYAAIILFLLGAFAIIAGVFALKRRAWILVIISSGFAMLTLIGIPAFILTLNSETEFRKLHN